MDQQYQDIADALVGHTIKGVEQGEVEGVVILHLLDAPSVELFPEAICGMRCEIVEPPRQPECVDTRSDEDATEEA